MDFGALGGRYSTLGLLGEGGDARVWRVRHNEHGTLHAMKVLRTTDAKASKRLLREGRVMASLDHPNLVTVTDVLLLDGRPSLVMELVDGPDLDQWLTTQEPSRVELVRIFRSIVLGVAYLHERGLVHRDLKPGNILLKQTVSGLQPKITDFGVVKVINQPHLAGFRTWEGVTLGTPGYMAPEQIESSRDVDARADLFALGALLYRMLCGRSPFQAATSAERHELARKRGYQDPRQLVPHLEPALAALLHGLLEPAAQERIGSCAEVLHLLDAWVPMDTPEDPELVEQEPSKLPWVLAAVGVAVTIAAVLYFA